MTTSAATTAPWYYSASQLKTSDLCIRKWAWEKICGYEEPPGKAAVFGQKVHSALERWLSKGEALDQFSKIGQVAFTGLDWLPPPGPDLEVERYFKIQVGDFYYRGYVDLSFMNADGVPWVMDHKTTRDFIWQLSMDDLMHDVQALLYAKEALDRHGVDRVHLRWVYYLTTEPFRSRITECTMTREQVDSRWGAIDDLARETDKVRLSIVNPLDLPPNAKACSAYGGCPHLERCNLTPREIRKSIFAMAERKTLLSKIKDRSKNKGSAPKAKPVSKGKPKISVVPDADAAPAPKSEEDEYQKFLAFKRAKAKAEGRVEVPEQQEIPEVNPPEQPDEEEQLSSEQEKSRSGRTSARANEQEQSTPKTRRTRTTKPKGFVIDDERTAKIFMICAAVIAGAEAESAGAAIEELFDE